MWAGFCCRTDWCAAPRLVRDYGFLSSEPHSAVRIHDDAAWAVLWDYQWGQPLFLLMLFFETKTSCPCSTHSLPCDLGKVPFL